MSRRYYGRKNYYRRGNVLNLSRTEREIFAAIGEIIRFILIFIVEFSKGLYKLSKYIRKIVLNFYALKKIGYDLDYILDMLVYDISPRQFEVFIAELYKQHGHKVRLTAPSSDYGRDVIVDDDTFIECKRFKPDGTQIGREICMKLLGSCKVFNAKKAIIITTGKYHKNAYEIEGMVDNLILLDLTDIRKMILDLQPEQIAKVIMKTKNAS